MIETTAVIDRTFQQRQILQGKPTENISVRSVVGYYEAELRALEKKRVELEGFLVGDNDSSEQREEPQ